MRLIEESDSLPSGAYLNLAYSWLLTLFTYDHEKASVTDFLLVIYRSSKFLYPTALDMMFQVLVQVPQ